MEGFIYTRYLCDGGYLQAWVLSFNVYSYTIQYFDIFHILLFYLSILKNFLALENLRFFFTLENITYIPDLNKSLMFKFGHRIVNNSILQLTKFWAEYIMYVRSLFIYKVESFLDLSSSLYIFIYSSHFYHLNLHVILKRKDTWCIKWIDWRRVFGSTMNKPHTNKLHM